MSAISQLSPLRRIMNSRHRQLGICRLTESAMG
jgi:hypothetical protein